ncbi:S1C family serine protease [Mycobacterium noviomagense]|uniref:Peptidase S1 n=1 Tax=Mycobacterium noviomagense TaxID=459858 RepID=A0A7I7PI04_9MYCO|nr:trypsin-like peptidase domain-containing protein [Mycobacterium noviomagense]ORB11207.1 serine protease [Mycobacterium noviomagense]BBY08234.1 peptidase S1 [Mycobacterium noviomagense]
MTQLPAAQQLSSAAATAGTGNAQRIMKADHREAPNARHQSLSRDIKLFAGAMAVAVISGIIGATAVLAVDPFGDQHAHGSASALWPTLESPDYSLERAVAKAVPSVVKLETDTDQLFQGASGVVWAADGLILTNSSEIVPSGGKTGGDGSMKTVATFADGRTAPFSVVGLDLASDLAVVRAQGVSGLTPITVGSSANLHVGQKVAAVGSPLGLQSTVTTGVISALHRPVPTIVDSSGRETVLDAIQTDASLNPGSLGGALIDNNGELIGVTAVIAATGANLLFGPSGSNGLGFAVPVDQAKRIARELITTGKASHAYLGVRMIADDTHGAKVTETQPGSPAAAAGLVPGTVITMVDNRVIATSAAAVAAILSKAPGDTVTLTYTDTARNPRTTRVVLASDREWPADHEIIVTGSSRFPSA